MRGSGRLLGRREFSAALGASILSRPAWAVDFPEKAITLIVPFAAGGAIDVVGRIIAEQAGQSLGQPIVIDNRGGAAGLIGAAGVVRAEADGYTLLLASAAQVTIPPWINKNLTFDPSHDLIPVAHLVDTPMVLVVGDKSPAMDVNGFVTAARAHRGGLNYASTGVGTISNLVMEQLKLAADIDVVHVPYRGAAPALNDLWGGRIHGMFTSTASAAPMIASGKLRPLAVTSPTRSPLLPDVPTMTEAGWASAEVVVWMGIMAPINVPPVIVRRLQRAFVEAALSEAVHDRLIKLGAEPVGRDARQFADLLEKDLARWRKVALASGIRVE